jgi:hypothetical protein
METINSATSIRVPWNDFASPNCCGLDLESTGVQRSKDICRRAG